MTKPGRIKTFRANTVQEALNRIRIELGPDAEILETKPVRGGLIHLGRSRIQVTASSYMLDRNDAPPAANNEQSPSPTRIPNHLPTPNGSTGINATVGTPHNVSVPQIPPSFSSPISSLPSATTHDSLASNSSTPDRTNSRRNEYDRGSHSGSQPEFHRDYHTVYAELLEAQIQPAIAQRWIEAAQEACGVTPSDPWLIRASIAQQIRALLPIAMPLELQSNDQHRIAFVGLSGVGKTTTIAKLACMLTNDHGLRVGILSTDFRTGSNNQLLQRSATLMDWDFACAANTAEIENALEQMGHCDAILIDTPPWIHDHSESNEWFEEIFVATQPNRTQLLINAASNSHSFARTIAALDWLIAPELILTKIDEAGGIGSLFDSICEHKLPVSFTTSGTKIPNDIAQATSSRLAQYIMGTT